MTYVPLPAPGADGNVMTSTGDAWASEAPGGGGGAVDSVNGQTGVVVLDASDVGADPAGTASAAVASHVAAVDPHGDRAYTDGVVAALDAADVGADPAGTTATHAALTVGAHGMSTLGAQIVGEVFAADMRTDLGLAAVAASGSASDLGSGTLDAARLPSSGVTPGSYTSADITVDATGRITSAANGSGGGDGWTYAFLAADHTNTTTTPTDVPGLELAPSKNTRYEIEGRFFVRAAATTTGAQIGVVWPTGIVAPSAAHLGSPSSATALTLANVTRGTTGAANATGVPSTTLEALGLLTAILTTGASPSGTFKIRLDSEVAASEARMLAGSFIRYREIPTS